VNFTKSTLLTVIYSAGLLTPTLSVAAPDPDQTTFQADKEHYIATILERIQIAQKNLSCVQVAQDHAALTACGVSINQEPVASEPKVKTPVITDKKAQKDVKNKGK
jgi:hypothetical protein